MKLTKVQWKPIQGFSAYTISSTGTVRKHGEIRKPFNNNGYWRIFLHQDGKHEKYLVHRLVALHFLPTLDTNLQVNHKDMDKRNNRVSNLEWVTNRENVMHALKHTPGLAERTRANMQKIGREYGARNGSATNKPVCLCGVHGEVVRHFESAREAARELGISYKGISRCCTGDRAHYKGQCWRFASREGATTIEKRVTTRT